VGTADDAIEPPRKRLLIFVSSGAGSIPSQYTMKQGKRKVKIGLNLSVKKV
jgi:hypothetical protein